MDQFDSLKQQGFVEIGKFLIGPKGEIVGPKKYLESASFEETKKKLENGTHVLIAHFPPGSSIQQIMGVTFQTDYAAWKGAQEMLAWGSQKK